MTKFYVILLAIVVQVTLAASGKSNDNWHYKFTYTENINSQMSLECGPSKAIWIGWSHYGTRNPQIKRNSLDDTLNLNL